MTPTGPAIRRLLRSARTALLTGCLSLLALQQFGHGACEVLNVLRLGACCPAAQAIRTTERSTKGSALSCDSLAPACEAALTERKTLVLTCACRTKPTAPRPLDIFHNNCRPVILRTRGIFCHLAHLRHILHPHFSLLAHASSVLC